MFLIHERAFPNVKKGVALIFSGAFAHVTHYYSVPLHFLGAGSAIAYNANEKSDKDTLFGEKLG